MARLADYGIHVEKLKNSAVVSIQGYEFPIAFTMVTMEYIADIYGGDYSKFESDMNAMISKKNGAISIANLTKSDLKIMRALIYAMLKTGGLEDTPEDIFLFLGMNRDLLEIYGVCMEIFTNQTFQVEDIKKSKKPRDFKTSKQIQKRKNQNKRKGK
ncbi:hypothetical protein EGW35_05545 [Enterococcus durans]|uniref:hypothetical protein n=1 Tax=Enterococcus durans TaxID=53345 RepID=UPI000F4FCA26|nr:hypothetical protein [Enterococcus durans]QED60546.1 hypothetical protein FS851_12425 [Enterococcus durans]QED63136.1 hypothetical protein FUT28_12355 [Enterococcus durans]ROX83676.1 hypothetical protein EGW35_05545 [Enterococcus durans]